MIRYTGYHGMYQYMIIYHVIQTHCWCDKFAVNFVKWHETFIDLDMLKNIHWPWYDTVYSMPLTFSWWDTNASGPSRAPAWSRSVMRSFGCSSPPGLVEVNPHPILSCIPPPPLIYSLPYPLCSSLLPLKFHITLDIFHFDCMYFIKNSFEMLNMVWNLNFICFFNTLQVLLRNK